MIEKINKWLPFPTLIVVVIVALVLVGGNNQSVGGTTNYDALDVTDGYYVDGILVIDSTGVLTSNAGILKSYTTSTTTGTTVTLQESDILNYDTISVTPIVGALTFTFPASSTLTSLVPTAGDMQETCITNATTTAAATITFAAGTGVDLKVATSTGNVGGAFDLTIGAGDMGCFKFVREQATASTFDIIAALVEYGVAD